LTHPARAITPTQPSPIKGEGSHAFIFHVPPPRWGRLGGGVLAAAQLIVVVALLALAIALPAHAVEPDEMLKNPQLEARAELIGRELRCPVCKTESIEESDAPLTAELRRIVRERVAAGDTDQQVLDYMHSRYGDFILLNPPFEPSTWGLWLAPPLLLITAGGIAFFVIRRRGAASEPAMLSDSEKAAIEALK
jgi:cytochrome c-type biogenesis protein CcmH